MFEDYYLIDMAARILEVFGVIIILVAVFYSLGRAVFEEIAKAEDRYSKLRRRMGRGILLGLEILVAADIIATIMTKPDLNSALALAVIVIIRTILSLSIEVEIDGSLPWRKNAK